MCNPKAADGGVLGFARVHLEQGKGSLVDVARITKVTATRLAKTSQKAVYSLLSTLLTATLVLSASLFLYGTFYYAYMPKEVHESDVNFQFSPCEDTPDMCSFPTATIDTRRQKLMTGQPYSINMLLEVPDSPNNHAMGMFMSCIHMRTADGNTIDKVCKSNILEYRSELLRILETFVLSPLLLTSTTTQRQWININYFKEFFDDPHSPATHIDLEIRSRHVHVYSATLQVHAEFTGLRAIMYHHPWISSFIGVSSNIFILSVILLISWARFIAPEASESASEEEVVEHEEDGQHHEPEQEQIEEAVVGTDETKETIATTEKSDTPVVPKRAGFMEKLATLLLILPNFGFAVLGLALVLAGVYLQVVHKESFNFIQNVPTPFLLIGIGSAMFLVSFIACRGARRSSPFLLNFYSFVMVLMIIAEVTCVALSVVYVNDFNAVVAKYGKEAMDNYQAASHEGVTATWDTLQQKLQCCGATSLKDWEDLLKNTPDTCCKEVVTGCGSEAESEKFATGCIPALEGIVTEHKKEVGGVGVAVLLLQLLAFKLARSVVKGIRKRSQKID